MKRILLRSPGVQDQFSGLLNIVGIHILIQMVKMDETE